MRRMTTYATNVVKELRGKDEIHGIVAAGGSGGTSLASAVMRNALPIGLPKLIVSTVASGDTGGYVEETDITLMYSVVDIAGLNPLLRRILGNAGAAIAAMAKSYASLQTTLPTSGKKRVGITMFGVTTPAVDKIRQILQSQYNIECYVFHATGHGGKAMERLVPEEGLDAVLDLTTTELCDLMTGGTMAADESRLEVTAKAGIPNIVSVGATDMTNWGPRSTVPERYKDRLLYEHNSMVTLMRSSPEECKRIGDFIADKLKSFSANRDLVEVWLPKGGVSMLSTPGGPFEDRDADAKLFDAIKGGLLESGIRVVEDSRAINDEGFATDVAHALLRKMGIRD